MTDIPLRYDSYGRLQYHPDIHARHKKPWTTSEEKYLIENYAKLGPDQVAMALERTIGVIMTRACALRKEGKMPKWDPATPKTKRTREIAKQEAKDAGQGN